MTAVEWLVYELVFEENDNSSKHNKEVIKKAKEMERNQSHAYAEFAIRCDRKGMKILNFEDWMKL